MSKDNFYLGSKDGLFWKTTQNIKKSVYNPLSQLLLNKQKIKEKTHTPFKLQKYKQLIDFLFLLTSDQNTEENLRCFLFYLLIFGVFCSSCLLISLHVSPLPGT